MITRTASGSPEDGEEAGLSESGSRVLVMTVGTGERTRLAPIAGELQICSNP